MPPPSDNMDLWILAGQSNMEGIATFTTPFPTHPRLWSFGLDLEWALAAPPLHHLYASKLPAHRLRMERMDTPPAVLDELARQGRASAPAMCGPGYFFGMELVRQLEHRSIALLPCAHGGTPLSEWLPQPQAPRGTTLYSAMLEQVRASGLRPTGMLWYQGESDAKPGLAESYFDRFSDFVAAVRRDLEVPNLPIFTVQLARIAEWPDVAELDLLRNQQVRALGLDNVFCTSALDEELEDHIHLDLAGQQRLGRRLARVALGEHYGQREFGAQIRLAGVTVEWSTRRKSRPWKECPRHFRVELEYAGLTGAWRAKGRPAGYSITTDRASPMAPELIRIELNEPQPGTVTLWLPSWLEPGNEVQLAYGAGVNPYCNLIDAADLPPLAFTGLRVPLEAEPRRYTVESGVRGPALCAADQASHRAGLLSVP